LAIGREFKCHALEDIGDLLMPDNTLSYQALAWLQLYATTVGDKSEDGTITIEAEDKKAVWCLYKNQREHDNVILTYSPFTRLWVKICPAIQLEVYHEIGGTCPTCELLSGLRELHDDAISQRWFTRLKEMHHANSINEQMHYHDRREAALYDPDNYMSLGTDGMRRGSAPFPNLAHQVNFSKPVRMHLQGTIDHGDASHLITRTWANIHMGANVVIHSILLQI
jgi:hypothetical protein